MTDPYVPPPPHIDLPPPHVEQSPYDPNMGNQFDPSQQQPIVPAHDIGPTVDHAQFDQAQFDQAQFDPAQFDQAQFDQAHFDQAQFDQQFDPTRFSPPDASYAPDPPGFADPPNHDFFAAPDPPTFHDYVAPDPPGFAPDPPGFGDYLAPDPPQVGGYFAPDPPGFGDYSAPDPPQVGGYFAPDPPGFADNRVDDPTAFGDYFAPDPPGFGDYLAQEPPVLRDYLPPEPPVVDDYRAAAAPAPADGPVLGFAMPADVVDDIGQAQNQPAAPNATDAAHPDQRADAAGAAPATSGDPFDKMRPGEVTWIDDSGDSAAFAGVFDPTKPTLVRDPDSPNTWLLQMVDPNPADAHLIDHGRDLGSIGMGKVSERETITLARIETPDGSAPAVGVLRGVDDRMTIVVSLPPGGSLAETTAPLNNVVNIYGFANHPAPPGTSPGEAVPPPGPAFAPPDAAAAPPPPTPQPPTQGNGPPPVPPPPVPPPTPASGPSGVPLGPESSFAPSVNPSAGVPHQPGPPPPAYHQAGQDDDRHPDHRAWLDQGGPKQPTGRPHPAKAKDPAGGEEPAWSGTGKPDPDGVNRTPGRTSRSYIQTPEGMQVLRNAETTLASDPSFRDVAHKVRDRMRSDSYENYQKNLSTEIKKILGESPDHPLKTILEVRPSDGRLVWKAGTSFAGQELHFAHTLSQQSIKNSGGPAALGSAPENLEPVGGRFHLKEYGHLWERLTNHLKNTPQAGAASVAGTKDVAISRVRAGRTGQAGFVTIGGLVFLAVTTGTVITIIKASESRTQAIAELTEMVAGVALQEIIVRGLGGGVGFAVGVVFGMRSDDKETSERRAVEEARHEAVNKFIDNYLAETVSVTPNTVVPPGLARVLGVSTENRHYDIAVQNQVYDLLFGIPPTRPEPIR